MLSLYNLENIFKPESIAIIGASETKLSIGRALMENPGDLYPVNPKYDNLMGRKSHRGISSVSTPVDLAVIAVPIGKVPTIMEECVDSGVKAAIIILQSSAGSVYEMRLDLKDAEI